MHKLTLLCLAATLCLTSPLTPTAAAQGHTAADLDDQMLQFFDPDLLKRAEEKGIYKRAEYPVLRSMNPFFIRGDFNGDGAMDLAFWVTQKSTGFKGVAVIHSSLDTVRYLGAGQLGEYGSGNRGEIGVDTWHLRPAGSVEPHVNTTIPQIGAVDGQPFKFERETLEFVFLGKSSFACYWANGRYWVIWTSD